jgi:hypothetical protein
MKLRELKKGDKLEIYYGCKLRKAIVIENFPEIKKIKLKIRIKVFYIPKTIEIILDYWSYNFDHINFKK